MIFKVADFGRITSKSLIDIYKPLIDEKSEIVSDSLRSYHKLMKELGVVWRKIPSGLVEYNGFSLEPINHLHGNLKRFLSRFHGISLRYLQGYLAYFHLCISHKLFYHLENLSGIFDKIFTTPTTLRIKDIHSNKILYA